MAYTTIDDPTIYFNTKLYTGNGTAIGSGGQAITGVNFQPDWTWIKVRSISDSHQLYDAVRGGTKGLRSDTTGAEGTNTEFLSTFDTDGFTVGNNSKVNQNSATYVSWNWLAGGTAPAITYSVKVVSDSGNKYRFDDFGTSAVTLDLQEGGTYTFDQSDSSNSGHPLRFSTTSNGTHGGGSEYTTGITTTGTPGSAGAKTVITVAASAPTLYYYCTQHSGMGGQANTNSTFGSSNFSGSIQSTVSANTTAGFSIVKWTGDNSSTATIGHSLGSTPSIVIVKRIDAVDNWYVYSKPVGNTSVLNLDTSSATAASINYWNNTDPTTTVFTVGDSFRTTGSFIAYCFTDKKGYSKFGNYTGNGNADGAFIYTGFKPAWVLIKRYSATEYWGLIDNKRPGYNLNNRYLAPNRTDAEVTYGVADLLSNGFKNRGTGSMFNTSGSTYLYMAFAENPFVNSNGVPTNAK